MLGSPNAKKGISDGFDSKHLFRKLPSLLLDALQFRVKLAHFGLYEIESVCGLSTKIEMLQPIIQGKIESDKVDSNQLKSI
jgi:hypothetical protein